MTMACYSITLALNPAIRGLRPDRTQHNQSE